MKQGNIFTFRVPFTGLMTLQHNIKDCLSQDLNLFVSKQSTHQDNFFCNTFETCYMSFLFVYKHFALTTQIRTVNFESSISIFFTTSSMCTYSSIYCMGFHRRIRPRKRPRSSLLFGKRTWMHQGWFEDKFLEENPGGLVWCELYDHPLFPSIHCAKCPFFYSSTSSTIFALSSVFLVLFELWEPRCTESPEMTSHSEYLAEDGTECNEEVRGAAGLCVQGKCEQVWTAINYDDDWW